MGTGDFEGRIALVTGATRGIGRAVARRLAAGGAHVIACGRTQHLLESLDDEIVAAGGERPTLVPFNLRDFPAIDRLGAAIFERWRRLDVLVGNAGQLGQLGPLGHIKPDAWTDGLDVNLTANWRLIRSMDPLLRLSDAGRAVFVTSGASVRPRAYWGAYSVTKAALDALVLTYADEVQETALKVNLYNPGPTATGMRAKAYPGEDPATLPSAETRAEEIAALCLASLDFSARRIEAGG